MNYFTDSRPTILLLCIGLGGQGPVPNVKTPGVWDLVEIFCPFGSLRKIAIFSRTPSTKAFLEFSFPEEALFAKEFMHESSINDFGCARLILSNRQQIESSKELLDYWDYNMSNSLKSLTRLSTDNIYLGDSCSVYPAKEAMLRSLSFQLLQSSEIGSPTNRLPTHPVGQIFNQTLNMPSDPNLSQPWALSPGTECMVPVLSKPFVIRPSKVVLASNLDHFFDSAIQLFNLFSCFGNLSKVLLMKNLQKAMLQYTSLSGSQQCIDYFTEHPLEEMALRVNFSKYSKIDLKKRNKSENSQQYNDIFVVPSECHRFPANGLVHRSLTPSSVLLVLVEIREDGCLVRASSAAIRAIRALGVEPINARNETKSHHHARLRVTFPFLKDSMLIISKLHRARIDGFVLNVLFSM